MTRRADAKIGRATIAIERQERDAAAGRVISTGWRARFAAWRRRRRFRAMVARLDQALQRPETRVADHVSAALLAVLTERIARISTLDPTVGDLPATIALAQRVVDEYDAYLARVRQLRDSDRTQALTWRGKVATAETAGRRDLAALAQDRVRDWERRELQAAAAIDQCEAGRVRLRDAVAQLQALAARTAAPGLPGRAPTGSA